MNQLKPIQTNLIIKNDCTNWCLCSMNPGQDIIIFSVSKDSRIPITRPKSLEYKWLQVVVLKWIEFLTGFQHI
jgi:hypothetical protein